MPLFPTIGTYFDVLSQSQKLYSRQLEPICRKWELTRSELDVVLFLYNNPDYDRAADIVARRGMAKSHVSISVASLEQRGLLRRQFSETDRRTAHLKLTEPGRTIAAEGREAQQQFFAFLYRDISPDDFRLWEEITRKVCKNIEDFDSVLTNP